MKKIFLMSLCAMLLFSALALTSCDQDSVDSMVNGIVDAGASTIGPFFDKAESWVDSTAPTDNSAPSIDSEPLPESSNDVQTQDPTEESTVGSTNANSSNDTDM